MKKYKEWLEEQIEKCLNEPDLQKEHWAFCKAYEYFVKLEDYNSKTLERADEAFKAAIKQIPKERMQQIINDVAKMNIPGPTITEYFENFNK